MLTRVDSADWTKDLVAFLVWSGAGPETLAGVARSAKRVQSVIAGFGYSDGNSLFYIHSR